MSIKSLTKKQQKDRGYQRAFAYYLIETNVFRKCKHYNHELNNMKAKFFTLKLLEERGIPLPKVTFKNRKWHWADYKKKRIGYSSGEITVGNMCHEVAHYIQLHEGGKTDHNYALLFVVIDVMNQFLDIEARYGRLPDLNWDTEVPEKPTLEVFINA